MKKVYNGRSRVIQIAAAMLFFCANQQLQAQNPGHVAPEFEKNQLSSTFYGEGAGIGDINGDGHPDVVAGPYWYEGPEFEDRHAYYEPKMFDPRNYSDNFILDVDDVNDDGRNDILVVGFPGEAARWYENPGDAGDYWESHLIHPEVDNESPQFYDLNGDGKLELVFHSGGQLGYAQRNAGDPTQPWTFTGISEQYEWGRFHHGLGIGDVDGDGLEDILMKNGWWQNPGTDQMDTRWQYHEAKFSEAGGAQMHTYDVDGDGLNDVITSLDAHGWGLAWYRQTRDGDEISFEQHLIMGEALADNTFGVRFSQPHALDLVDMDGDGVKDLVTGKRFWGHGPMGDSEPNAPAVLYWFKLTRNGDGSGDFTPYLVDDNSGVGVEVATGDISGNGSPDIVVSNKKGTFVFLNKSQPGDSSHPPQPKDTPQSDDSSQPGDGVLFNGQDLSGWEGDMQYWRVEDGMIAGEFTELEHNQFLRSKVTVDDFRLTLKVRVADGQGNSGIQFRSTSLPGGHVRGPQADIGKGFWGKLYEELGRAWLWEDGCDQHVDMDGWNEYEIVAVDSKVRTAVNGNLCVDIDDPYIAREGIIALQLHAGFPPDKVYFKDFNLEEDPQFRLMTVD